MTSAVAFASPELDYAALAPMLIVFGAALLGVLVEAVVPRRARFLTQVVIAGLALLAGLIQVLRLAKAGTRVITAGTNAPGNGALGGGLRGQLNGAVVIDGPALFLQGSILVLALLAVLVMSERSAEAGSAFAGAAATVPGSPAEDKALKSGLVHSEVFPLLLLSVGGMLLFPAAEDLLTMFVALEVLSLPLYLMSGLARRRRLLSQEAALKYFLLGAFASAFFLFGAALLYGFSGSIRLTEIAGAISGSATQSPVIGEEPLLLLGIALVAVGLLFKVGAAPFQAWTPDVYQGAPTPVTGFMAACTKVAAFGGLLRLSYVALPAVRWDWQPALWGVAILTMLVGSVIAVVQTDVKRMLAYSSIAHAGFLLIGVVALNQAGIRAVLFYLLGYGLTTVGAFALVTLIRDQGPEGSIGGEATHLSQWAGLGRRHPWIAGTFSLFLLGLAGIPLTSGFIGKFAVFSAVVQAGGWPLALVGVLASAIAAFFYVRVIVLMYFSPDPEGGSIAVVAVPNVATTFAIVVAAASTLVLGIVPSDLLDLAGQATVFLP